MRTKVDASSDDSLTTVDADIPHEQNEPETQRLLQDAGQQQAEARRGEGPQTPGLFVWTLTAAAALSGLLFGYDTGVISSTLVSIHTDLSNRSLTTFDKSLITSITSFGALLASPPAGLLADSLGRKPVILLSDVLFILGALLQAFSTTVPVMVIGRLVVGLAIGAASGLTPLYIAETAPTQWRGRLVTVTVLFITGGQVVAYLIGWAFSEAGSGWRWMVGLGAVPAVLQLVGLSRMPETPRWLVRSRQVPKAKMALNRIYGENETIVKELIRQMEVEIDEQVEETAGLKQTINALFKVKPNRKALIIACILQGGQQISGFNTLMYFSATIFALVGFHSPTGTALLIALTNFFFTLIAFTAIDRIGRRRILLLSIPFMSIGLLMSSFAFINVSIRQPQIQLLLRSNPVLHPWAPPLLVISLLIFVAAYALGLGNVPWQQSELFPLNVRAMGSGLATATNWACNGLVGLTFLPLMDLISPAGAMAVYAVVCGLVWVALWGTYPERMGVGLEEVRANTERREDG